MLPFWRDPVPSREKGSSECSSLFGAGYGFGGAFAYAKQVAAFAAGIMYPNEALPSARLADPPPPGHLGTSLRKPPESRTYSSSLSSDLPVEVQESARTLSGSGGTPP